MNAGTITALSNSSGTATKGVYVNAGALTPMTYELKATVNAGQAGKLAYYSTANSVNVYTSNVGSNTAGAEVPMYLNAGVPSSMTTTSGGTAQPVYMNAGKISPISATVGSAGNATTAATPVYLNAGTITACNIKVPVDQIISSNAYYPIYMAHDTTAGSIEKIDMASQAIFSFNPSVKK